MILAVIAAVVVVVVVMIASVLIVVIRVTPRKVEVRMIVMKMVHIQYVKQSAFQIRLRLQKLHQKLLNYWMHIALKRHYEIP